ncbi:Recyclin-1 [Pseudozyma hubeiensis]|nr:Recyclin-1 [Pseudozyma hubeiensis]
METTWAPLVPTSKGSGRISTSADTAAATTASASNHVNDVSLDPFSIGSLPSTVVQRILSFVPVAHLPSCALAARPLARFVADERLWAHKLALLQYKQVPGRHLRYNPDLSTVPATSRASKDETRSDRKSSASSSSAIPDAGKLPKSLDADSTLTANDDDFGDFEAATITSPDDDNFGSFVSTKPSSSGHSFSSAPVFSYRAESKLPMPSTDADSAYQTFKRIAILLKPFVQSLLFETSPTASLVFTDPSLSSLSSQAQLICNVARFTGPLVLGSFARAAPAASAQRDSSSDDFDQDQWRLRMSISQAADYLEGVLLSAFEGADARRADALRAGQRGMDVTKAVDRAESDMHEHATLIWNLATSTAAPSAQSDFHLANSIAADGEITDFLALLERPGHAAALSFLEKRDSLFKSTTHRPDANFASTSTNTRPALDFTAMDAFMAEVLANLQTDGSLVARVFPPEQQVLLAFASRVANEVVGEYINGVLTKARSIDLHIYLQAAAATFSQALKVADTVEKIEPRHPDFVTPSRCRAIVLSMFEAHLDEYLQEERDWVRNVMVEICKESQGASGSAGRAGRVSQSKTMDTAFLASSNPAQVKRNVLSGFKDVLLMPVTVVPRAAGAVGGAVIRTAGTGLSQLNPLKWQQSSATGARNASGSNSAIATPQRSSTPAVGGSVAAANNGYVDFSKEVLGGPEGHVIGSDDESDDGQQLNGSAMEKMDDFGGFADTSIQNEWNEKSASLDTKPTWNGSSTDTSVEAGAWDASFKANASSDDANPTTTTTMKKESATASTEKSTATTTSNGFERLQLLLSLDTALSLIQVHRESLKRMEAFMVYPPTTLHGRRVKDEMEEVCLSLFQVLGEQHIAPGFDQATQEIKQWNPLSDSDDDTSTEKTKATSAQVLPLVQFFELTHIADTISQLCSVYFSQTLVPVVRLDVDDFLNAVVRAKKSFEANLDESVASGLSVSVDLLMKRAEWVLFSQRDPMDYAGSSVVDLGSATLATRSTLSVLAYHCSLLVGATDREILDLFYTEVASRLFHILTKHLKSLTISQVGGFQLISDLNHIASFIAGLKIKDQDLAKLYNSLKTLANYYIVDGKELISLLKKDSAGSGGVARQQREDGFVFGQEELYEFLKSRQDFRAIEKQVDHEIFGFKLSEDCVVC